MEDHARTNNRQTNKQKPHPRDTQPIVVPLGEGKDSRYEAKPRWLHDSVLHWSFYYHAGKEDEPSQMTWAQVLNLWQCDQELQDLSTLTIRQSPFSGLFWECPPISARDDLEEKKFEFVVVDGFPSRAKPDQESFQEHFESAGEDASVAVFQNLGGDAQLVVPCPQKGTPNTAYTHLAAVMRGEGEGGAPQEQTRELWAAVGESMIRRIEQMEDQPVWLSTAGTGVYWTHVRMDSRPKYYQYQEYKLYKGKRKTGKKRY